MTAPWPYLPQGDIEAAIIYLLTNSPHITGFPGGAPLVRPDYIGYDFKDSTKNRWIMVTREGGNLLWPKIDKPRVDLQVLGPTRTVAHNLAQVAQAVVLNASGQSFPSFGTKITNVQVETGVTRVPDRETGSPRYISALRLTCVPVSL